MLVALNFASKHFLLFNSLSESLAPNSLFLFFLQRLSLLLVNQNVWFDKNEQSALFNCNRLQDFVGFPNFLDLQAFCLYLISYIIYKLYATRYTIYVGNPFSPQQLVGSPAMAVLPSDHRTNATSQRTELSRFVYVS